MLHVQNGFLRFIKNILPINFSIILNQFCAISLGVFFKFLFIGIYLWLTDKDLSWIANPMGYLGLFFFYIFFIEIYFILANISSSVYWFCAKKKRREWDISRNMPNTYIDWSLYFYFCRLFIFIHYIRI
jgi:hypothetical protein